MQVKKNNNLINIDSKSLKKSLIYVINNTTIL